MQIVYVTYTGTSETWFDRAYYVDRHLPLVMHAWAQYGLDGVSAFFPATDEAGTIAICECRFFDAAAIERCFNAPETKAVMADVAQFTDVAPERVRGVPL